MKRLIPYPLLAAFLFTMWMVLGSSYSLGRIVTGAIIAIGGAWAMTALQLDSPRLRRPMAVLRLLGVVTIDILRSNIAVARIILYEPRPHAPRFMVIPLDLRAPAGLAVLGCIITATPGTIWSDYDRKANLLLIHILDLIDEDEWIRIIKGRYERLLMEVFE